jgi:hypothetical protein
LPPDLAATTTKVAAIIDKRCTTDKWSDEARSCFATAETNDEMKGCAEAKLTEAQRKSVEDDMDAVEKEPEAAGVAKPAKPTDAGAAPKRATRGASPKGGSTPKGANSSDPCQGGQ